MRIWIVWLLANLWTAAAATPLAITTTQVPDGLAGQLYSFQLHAAGGTPPYMWRPVDAQQVGIELDTDTGLLHGLPSEVGLSFIAQVTDSAGQTAEKFFSVHFWGPVQLSNTPAGRAGVGYFYSVLLFYQTGMASLVSGALPPGLVLQPTGILQGTPTQTGSFTFTVTATGFAGDTLTHTFTVVVVVPVSIAISPTFSFTAQQRASIPWVVSGGVPPYNISVTGQPDGMVLSSGNMALTGAPAVAGSYRVLFTAVDQTNSGQTSLGQAITVVTVLPALSVGALSGSARQNNTFSTSLAATGGAPPYSWKVIVKALPARPVSFCRRPDLRSGHRSCRELSVHRHRDG